MNWTGKRFQNGAFAGMLVLLSIAAMLGYRLLNQRFVLFRQARVLYAQGRSDMALPLFVKSIEDGVSSPESLTLAADAALRSGRKELAVSFLDAFVREGKRPTLAQLNEMAGVFDGAGMPGESARLFRRYESTVLADQTAALRLADFLRRSGDYAQARQAYAQILKTWPGLEEATLALAETEGWAGDYGRALDLTGELLRSNPGDRRAGLLYARLLSWSGRFSEAIVAYRNYLGDPS